MCKKIEIPSNNIKSHLVDLFHNFMKTHHNKSGFDYDDYDYDDEMSWLMKQGYVFDGMAGDYCNYYDDDDDEDGYNVIWPPKNISHKKKCKGNKKDSYEAFWEGQDTLRKKKKHKRGKCKRARIVDINQPYSGEEDNPNEVGNIYSTYEEVDDNGLTNGKEIYYYPNYHDKDSRLEFNTLKGFQDFCEENGYTVPQHIAHKLLMNRVNHCCLRPDVREFGLYEIMAEESYGVMFYEVCDANELGY